MSCDLHLEHLNHRLKDMIRGLHSNVIPKALVRASRSVGIVHQVCDKLSTETGLHKKTGCHTRPSFTKECTLMVEEQRFSDISLSSHFLMKIDVILLFTCSIESFHHVFKTTNPPYCCTSNNGNMCNSRLFKSF